MKPFFSFLTSIPVLALSLNPFSCDAPKSLPSAQEETSVQQECTTTPSRLARILGSLELAAAGDALGKVTEFSNMGQIRVTYGSHGVRTFDDFLPQNFWQAPDGTRFAPYTDDTQMTLLTLETLLEGRATDEPCDSVMGRIARGFIPWSHDPDGGLSKERAPGLTCLAACKELEQRLQNGMDVINPRWWDVGGKDKGGCGSVMRAHPFGLVYADDQEKAITWAAEHSSITHGHPWARAACAAMAAGVATALNDETPDAILTAMVEAAQRYDQETADLITWAREQAHNNTSSELVFDKLRGWTAHEAIAAAAYTFARAYDNPELAMQLGVNTPGDSDSIASMAGALVGAYCGLNRIPRHLYNRVENWKKICAYGEAIADQKRVAPSAHV